MKYLYLSFIFTTLLACTDRKNKTPELSSVKEKKAPTVEVLIVRQIEGNLSIPATEDYSYTIYSEELNGDDSLDYIVTVNRLDFALNKAIEKGNTAQRAEMGYIGKYNFIFYMDGASKKITQAIPVPSSPHGILEVSFENIKTEAYKDILVDFKIRNSKFRRYFSVTNKIPLQTFETLIFDGLGTDNNTAYHIEYGSGSYSLSKDILVYKADLEDIEFKHPNDIYSANPKISSTGELERLWFFNDYQNKYFTQK
ncbi:MAG: hypothetical protein P8N52_08050 [Crocinitomicaceae bacterium]|nr:hypothetical protein [Crocinitomicaceae bacterium]MDG1776347.1 hypothetical protein [Crocinitomicaceae bacterium]